MQKNDFLCRIFKPLFYLITFDRTLEEWKEMDYSNIITIESGKRSGKPCIRGLRITVGDVLGYLASGMTIDEVLDDFPDLTRDDILACFAYAADTEKKY